MFQKIKSILGVLLVSAIILSPIEVYAARIGSSSRVSRSISSNRTLKVKTSTSTYKPKNTTKITRVPKPTKSTKIKNSSTKVDSGNFSTKPKTNNTNLDLSKPKADNKKIDTKKYTVKPKTTKTSSNYKPSYYTSYNRTPFTFSNGFLTYYMLDEVFDVDDVITEQDIARELEKKGYTKEEIDTIIKTEKQNVVSPTKEVTKTKSPLFIFGWLGLIIGIVVLIIRKF